MMSPISFMLRGALVPALPMMRSLTSAATATQKPYGHPTTYRHGIWQGTPPMEPVKPNEFWPAEAMTFKAKMGWSSRPSGGHKILVAIGTTDWAGSVTALRTAFAMSGPNDHVVVFNAPKAIPDSQPENILKEGLKMAALLKNVQAIAKEYNRPLPKIEMAPSSPQPKIEVVKKAAIEDADLLILGHGRYPWNQMGNVASYVTLHAPCDVLVVKGGSETVDMSMQ